MFIKLLKSLFGDKDISDKVIESKITDESVGEIDSSFVSQNQKENNPDSVFFSSAVDDKSPHIFVNSAGTMYCVYTKDQSISIAAYPSHKSEKLPIWHTIWSYVFNECIKGYTCRYSYSKHLDRYTMTLNIATESGNFTWTVNMTMSEDGLSAMDKNMTRYINTMQYTSLTYNPMDNPTIIWDNLTGDVKIAKYDDKLDAWVVKIPEDIWPKIERDYVTDGRFE